MPATKISTPQLDITSFATDQIVTPGSHFSIVIDAQPAKGIQVYAPGVSGYKPVALTNEYVKVFQHPMSHHSRCTGC